MKKASVSQIKNPQSICILRLSAIGDVCHAVASVQAIQNRFPDAKITWVIGKVEFMLLDGLPNVEFIIFDKSQGSQAYRQLKQDLNKRQFDILLHMQVAFRASRAARIIKAKEKWGFDFSRAKEAQWLFTNKKIAQQKAPHVADGFLGFAKAIGVKNDHQLQWEMPIAEKDIQWQKENFKDIKPYVVIAPAASKDERNWLPERYAKFAGYVHAKGYSVVLCGGPTDREKQLAEKIIKQCDAKIFNWVGKTTLKQLLVILKNAVVTLAPDTGPAHMSVVVDTPVIGLYAHSNPNRTGPYKYLDYVVSVYEESLKEATGKSSSELPWGTRVKGDNLMEKIQVEQVTKMFEQIIEDLKLPIV